MVHGRIQPVPGILIDVTQLVLRRAGGMIPTGIDRVGLEYIRHHGDHARAVLSCGIPAAPLSRADSERLFAALLEPAGPGFRRMAIGMAAKDTAWNWIRPRAGNSILLNCSTMWLRCRHYAAQLRWLGARLVFVVYDLIPISHPEYFPPGRRQERLAAMRNILSIAQGIVVISESTEAALRRQAEEFAVSCPPIVVAPIASGIAPLPVPSVRHCDSPYFVIVSTIEPRKNHLLLLNVWREIVARKKDLVPKLYVIGQRGWECENVVDLLERCVALKGVVIERNDCGDAEAASLLHHAQALLMPTFAEGFGLPVAEALAAGVPVIASDLPVFREVAGEVPEYVDPIDGRRWMELILDYARPDSARRAAQLERIKGHRPTTWAQHFEIVDRFLEALP
jgi:glycosyltransferase involved in cell wall biosynthesis